MKWLKRFVVWFWTGRTLTDNEILDRLNQQEKDKIHRYTAVINVPGMFVPVVREYSCGSDRATLDLVYISSNGEVSRLNITGIDSDIPHTELPYAVLKFLNPDEYDNE